MRPFPILYTMLIGICSHVVLGIQPMLSSPGNTTILVLIDVHRNYGNNGNCTDPNWERLELAYSLWYNHDSRNGLIGLEIYDGCSSLDRTVSVLRDRLFVSQETVGTQAIVASIVTYIKPEVDDAISGTVLVSGASHVTLGPPLQSSPERKQTNGHIYIDLSPKSSIEVLHTTLKMLNWSYVTVLSDASPGSKWKHQHFLLTKDDHTCVQESLFNVSNETLESIDVKTDGVIMFASTSKTNLSALPLSTSVVVVTQDTRFARMRPKRQGIVLTEDFGSIADKFVEFLSGWLLQSPLNDLLAEYFTSQHDCSLDNTTRQIQCPDLASLKAEVRSSVSTKHFAMASKAVNALSQTLAESVRQNCTSFQAPTCFDLAGIERLFEASDMGYWVAKPSINVSITWLANEDVISSQMVEIIDTSEPGSNLTDALNNLEGFPESRCSGWCPACKSDGCDNVSQTPFVGNHAFTAGDVIIAGMFPLTRHLELGQASKCSGLSIGNNTDVIVEAFLYAIQTAQSRYSDLLPNVTIGSLVMDTCSDTSRTTQTIMNFESCQYNLGNDVDVTPAMVPAYITYKDVNAHNVDGLEKLQLSVTKSGKIYKDNSVLFDDALFNQDVVISLLRKMEWTNVGIITSASSRRDINVGAFYDVAASNGICIAVDIDLTGERSVLLEAIETIRSKISVGAFVMFADNNDVNAFFRTLLSNPVSKTWIVVGSRKNWYDFNFVSLPSGTLLLQGKGKLNRGFNSYLRNKILFPPAESTYKSWLGDFKKSRDNCTGCALPDRIADTDTKLGASDVIRAVDVTLHAIDVIYRYFCENIEGPCRDLYTKGFNQVQNSLSRVKFDYEGDTIDLMVGYQIMENYPILNIQSSRIAEIGSWSNGKLELDKSRYKAYGSSGDELQNGRRSACYIRCECLNIDPDNGTSGGSDGFMFTQTLDPEMGFMDSSGEFNKKLWCIVVVIIAGSGAFATVCLMMYVMSKVCAGALVRRYLALGLMLLVAMVFLFMSVLPFVFTPSEVVCGMRYLAHGFSYALCFAIILTKMTTLRNYRYIGLGGEISRINQLLSVFFITGVQVAIGIEWWVLRTPVVYTEANSTLNGYELTTHYACDFKRGDFLAYHSYVIFLVCVCCAYSFGVRKETNNMREARLLLISSWVSFVIWIAIILTLSVMEREHLEAICSVGILANALTLMVVIYFPKLTVISQLKYEVSDGKSVKANGYKIDGDFQFERVYSVPGTLNSGVTDKSLSFPRTHKAFDSGLTY